MCQIEKFARRSTLRYNVSDIFIFINMELTMSQKTKKLAYPKKYFETKAWKENTFVCGIDEVGRGCLAGPLVVSSAILPINAKHKLLKDSKILNQKEREQAFAWLIKKCFYSTVIISNQQIDKLNIYQATIISMKKAFSQILHSIPFNNNQIKYLLIDAMPIKLDSIYKTINPNLEIFSMNYGESISPSIAAASIIAKVTRDRLMQKINPIFPAFNLAKHKGYGTFFHKEVIKNNGISIIHRKTFTTKLQNNLIKDKKENNEQQQSLF